MTPVIVVILPGDYHLFKIYGAWTFSPFYLVQGPRDGWHAGIPSDRNLLKCPSFFPCLVHRLVLFVLSLKSWETFTPI